MLRFVKILKRVLIVFITTFVIAQLTACGVATPTPAPTPTDEYLDTPTLINQAYDRGEITEEERLLYLAYAVFEPESLPTRFQGNVEWFGEATVKELQETLTPPEVVCSMSPHVRSEFLRLFNLGTICD